MHFIAYSSLWFPFLLHLDWHKLCNMVVLISAPGGEAAGWRGWETPGAARGQVLATEIQFCSLQMKHSNHACVRVRVCECVSLHTRDATDHAFNKASRRSCKRKCLPKVLTSPRWHFHCWYKYHANTHPHVGTHTAAAMQVTQSSSSSIFYIGWHLPHGPALRQSASTSLRTQRIFLYRALVVERPSVKIVLGWEWGSYWVAAYGCMRMFVRACVCGLKPDQSEKPVLICPKVCQWRGANSQWLQLVAAQRERERERMLRFYLGGCGKLPSCLMLTGHLSNGDDATAAGPLCHVGQLWLPRCICCWKTGLKHQLMIVLLFSCWLHLRV